MLNGLYVKQVSEKFGARIGDLVSDTMEQCEHLVSEGVPYVEATVDIEQCLSRKDVPENVVRLCLVVVHAQYEGWDDTFEFFLGKDFELATDGQAELISWIENGNWL